MPPVALVTGGSRGIGLGISQRLVQDGFAVAILATRPEPVETIAELRDLAGAEDRVLYVQGSVADLADHRRYLDAAGSRWGRLDLLVNNAGVSPAVRADLLEATPESFDRVLGVNLRGPYFLTQAFAQAVLTARGDVKVDLTSKPLA
ncbi:MAG: SDR family NAD(P)-dependent oxidoreductase, partial [Propionibacteriaceae bacterium]|nr:SDR family NAD(P)-dependent oxidoreductase [Propionibacteriaceae bacterium]